ncbi:hypothetical protein ES319_A06G020500v1 [Gossypium barbadense]|uniref:Sterol carrier protein 2 n=3 Tax=Gossypium TaxID=3633 RepID=A0ABM3BUK0_GOSHI|nr:sterol carrier protein 2-like [Gossypium hirsutum]KAB2076134.1 hypothetical protein ES319_A06G020500v1 [Gossypium barbadense]TYI21193.1 hypothetical protein ES332_A06G020600v1 [Gossypium tomentosum]
MLVKSLPRRLVLFTNSILPPKKLGVDEVTYIIDLKKGDVIKGEYEGGKPDVIFSFKDDDFLEIATGKMNPQVAFMRELEFSSEIHS